MKAATPPLLPASPPAPSPASPMNFDSCVRASPSPERSQLTPRMRMLEAQAKVADTEVALLRQLGDDLGAWRHRIDAVTTQTCNALQVLHEDVATMKDTTAAFDAVAGQGVQQRLQQVESQLKAVQALVAAGEGPVSYHASESADLASQVQGLQLGLEVVEASLEEVATGEQLAALRSRLDDLDSGIERSTDSAAAVHAEMGELRTAVTEASAAAISVRCEVEQLREQVAQAATTAKAAEKKAASAAATAAAVAQAAKAQLAASLASSPQSQSDSSSSRIKAAVHTLSDGYRSLHSAMSLMYEEQAEVAVKVGTVGQMAAAGGALAPPPATAAARVRALNMRCLTPLGSHAVVLTPRTLASDGSEQGAAPVFAAGAAAAAEAAELRALLAAQVAESAREAARVDALQGELAALRALVARLATSPAPSVPVQVATKPAAGAHPVVQVDKTLAEGNTDVDAKGSFTLGVGAEQPAAAVTIDTVGVVAAEQGSQSQEEEEAEEAASLEEGTWASVASSEGDRATEGCTAAAAPVAPAPPPTKITCSVVDGFVRLSVIAT